MASKIPYDSDGLFTRLIYPVAIAKMYVVAVYDKMLGLIWDELFRGKSELNQTGTFVAFACFCLFSFLMYHFEQYVPYIIAILTLVWFMDVQLARHKYRNCKRNEIIRLVKTPQSKIILRKNSADGEVEYTSDLNSAEVNHISLYQADRKGGAFQERVATVWRSSVSFNDQSELLLSEDKNLSQALKKVRYISKLLGVQFKFKFSQDVDVAAQSSKDKKSEDNIKVETKNNRYKISTRWTSNMTLGFMMRVLKESGFFLFLLIVAGVMIKFGGLLIFLYDRFYGSGMVRVNMEFNFWGILSVFEPDWDVVDIVEYAAGITFLIRKTMLLARPQHVSIDRDLTRHYVNDNLAGECKTDEIKSVMLLTDPEPAILVLNSTSSIEVRDLKSMQEFKSFFHRIREGIEKYRAAPEKKGIKCAPGIEMRPDI
ncbi:MAG: hypothetical protein P8X90_09100 [Desulfobacterales bacterium]